MTPLTKLIYFIRVRKLHNFTVYFRDSGARIANEKTVCYFIQEIF